MICLIRLLIIADDFTGALDTGVQLSAAGARSLVVTAADPAPFSRCEQAQVLVVDAETRHLPPEQAARRVRQIVLQAAQQGIAHIYKKTDSALRGNIGAELSALLEASGESQLPFLPAFPQMGRTTVDGIHYIDAVPVSQSVFGADPFEPVVSSSVPQLIGLQCATPVLTARPGEHVNCLQPSIVVYDARSVEDLERTGEVLSQTGKTRILAGCAGFAQVLPRLLGLGCGQAPSPPPPCQRLLVVCGSVNPITLEQLRQAEQAGFVRFRLTPEQKLDPAYWASASGTAAVKQLQAALEQHPRMILDSNDPDGTLSTAVLAQERGLTLEQLRVSISQSLGQLTKALSSSPALENLLITGGDTLLACMDCLSVTRLEPLGEFTPGVVLSRFYHQGQTRHVISKSGGFGQPDLLLQLTAPRNAKPSEQEEPPC